MDQLGFNIKGKKNVKTPPLVLGTVNVISSDPQFLVAPFTRVPLNTSLRINCFQSGMQGGQNFFEHIRTKIRTFSEEIRTIFEKQSVQSVQFFLKIRTIRTFF